MNRIKYLILATVLCGCFTRHAYFTHQNYDSVQVGDPISQVIELAGEPYAIRNLKNERGRI
jgi:hypothetical protein